MPAKRKSWKCRSKYKFRPVQPSSAVGCSGRTNEGQRSSGTLAPEPSREQGAHRDVTFTERELNALLATNTDLAHKLAIDLSENLASAKLLVPLHDPDMPFFGGKTLKVRPWSCASKAGRCGISLWGVPSQRLARRHQER